MFCLLQFVRITWNENPLGFLTFSLSCALPVKIIGGPSIQSLKLLKIKWSCTKLRTEVSGALTNTSSNLIFLNNWQLPGDRGFVAHVGSTWHLHGTLLEILSEAMTEGLKQLIFLLYLKYNRLCKEFWLVCYNLFLISPHPLLLISYPF